MTQIATLLRNYPLARAALAFPLLAGLSLGWAAGGAGDQSRGAPNDGPAASGWWAQPPETSRREIGRAPGAPMSVPLAAAARSQGDARTSTTFHVANLSGKATEVTLRFRDGTGSDLSLPFLANQAAGIPSAGASRSSVEVSLAARQTVALRVQQTAASAAAWAEVTADPDVHVTVSAVLERALAGNRQDVLEIPSTPPYLQAWLPVDSTRGDRSELHLVNLDSESEQQFALEFRAGSTTCQATVTAASLASARVAVATALPCSAGRIGTVEIQAGGQFTGIGTAARTASSDTYARGLVGIVPSAQDPQPLSIWTVAPGSVNFATLSATECVDIDKRTIAASSPPAQASYTVHLSGWQRKATAAAEWTFVADSSRSGQLCSFTPQLPGEYRGVAEISIDGTRRLHSSSNVLQRAVGGGSGMVPPASAGYTALQSLTVRDGAVRLGGTSGSCVSGSVTTGGTVHQIHSSKWQFRESETAAWQDVAGTAQTNRICSHSPTANGQYRLVAEITRGGTRGRFASSNFLTRRASAPAGQPGAEECSTLVGCFIPLPAGEFVMGSEGADAAADESPLTTVRISSAFQIGKYEVNKTQWEIIMGPSPYDDPECETDCPAENMTWNEVQRFVERLNGRDPEYTYRLPTEAEWEYAARAGSTDERYGAVDAIAWHKGNSNGDLNQVGQKQANAWGLYDMLGNVFEWVQDYYGAYPGGTVTDPTGPATGSRRVCRGGSYVREAADIRFAKRQHYSAGYRLPHLGFRLVRTPK